MASDVPEVTLVGVGIQDDDPTLDASFATSLANSFPLLRVDHQRSPSDLDDFLSPPTTIPRNSQNSLDVPASPPLHTSDASSHLPHFPIPSAHASGSAISTVLRDNHTEEHDGLSSLGHLNPPSEGHLRKGSTSRVPSIGSTPTDGNIDNPSSHGLSPVRSGRSDLPSTHPPTHTHVGVGSAVSLPSSAASFFKRTVQHIRHPSLTPSSETMNSDTIQEASLNVEPFAFKPLELTYLVDPKNLENLESLGGVEGLLRGLGTDRDRGLRSCNPVSRDPGTVNAVTVSPDSVELARLSIPSRRGDRSAGPIADSSSRGGSRPGESVVCLARRGKRWQTTRSGSNNPGLTRRTLTSLQPNVTITSPANVPEGLPSAASLGVGSGAGRPASPEFSARADEATILDRQRIYGQNILPQRPIKSLLLLMGLALQDKVIVLLSIAAVVSLALGLFQDFGTTRPDGDPPVDWVQGVSVIAAVLVVVAVGSLNDWQKERQYQVLNEKKEDRRVKVIRDGEEQKIDVHRVVVGDVVLLEPGDVIPCDGVFLSGHNVRCDESSATGESDAIKKFSYEECIALRDKRRMEFDPDGPSGGGERVSAPQRKTDRPGTELLGHMDCFIVSGSKVVEGAGSYVVISVGTKSFNGRIMMALRRDSENTPLRLNDLAEVITNIGCIAGGLLFAALLVRYFVQLGTNNPQRTSIEKGIAFVNILIISVTLVVVAVPEGLPLAVTHASAFATKRMSKENLLVRVLGSCETMANASVICTDMTGTLTQNEMSVVAGSVGVHAKFVRSLEENRVWTGSEVQSGPNAKDFAVDLANLNTVLSHSLKDLFSAAIVNSTALEDVHSESGAPMFVGSKTETALLGFAKELGWPDYKVTRDSANIVHMIPFSSHRKSMGCVVRLADGSHRLYIKGASEVLARKCTRHVTVYRDTANEAPGGNEVETVPIGQTEEDNISHTIASYASQALLTISLCYRDFPNWPLQGPRLLDKDEVDYDDLTTDLTLICITAIEDPLRTGVREAVASCWKAGVRVKMCTGDNVLTARSIAQQCGIYTSGGIVMEGPLFRTLSPDVMKAIVPRLQVLARSSPEDKRILVETLKELGEVVGVTGNGANDGPALKTAHVGFSMGVAGIEVAKEASDIILMDDNFSSIVNALMWGRCVNDSVRKFLQFQTSAYFTTVVVMIVWALASPSEKPILGAVQLLWINVIMGTFAAVPLATDPASPVLLNRNPDKKTDPLFTVDMTKQILGQAVYQIIITLVLHFLGSRVLGFHHTDDPTLQMHHDVNVQTLVFNAFVFAQVSNLFNCRRLDRELNVFEGVSKNRYFMAITTIEVAVQVLICLVGGAAFGVTRMGAREWCISVGLGCISLPLGTLIRLTPNEPCERCFKRLKLLPEPELLPTIRPDAESGFLLPVDRVRDSLGTYAKLRGGVAYEGRFALPYPGGPDSLPGSFAMVPSPDVFHVAAPEWQPRTSGSLSNPIGFGRSGSSATLRENGFEIHPDTPRDDPVYYWASYSDWSQHGRVACASVPSCL